METSIPIRRCNCSVEPLCSVWQHTGIDFDCELDNRFESEELNDAYFVFSTTNVVGAYRAPQNWYYNSHSEFQRLAIAAGCTEDRNFWYWLEHPQ